MENYRVLKISITLLLIFAPQDFSNAYSISTHENLTNNIIDEYERLSGVTFTERQKALVVSGAKYEDLDARPVNHFFDPVNNRGLDLPLVPKRNASPEWATNPYLQATFLKNASKDTKLYNFRGDYSWHRAVYEYVHGDKESALKTLGHVLHLLEDLTSVPHTRNDAHSGSWFDGSSYYEDYTKGLDPDVHVDAIRGVNSVGRLFKDTAMYTNENFLSRDTVFENFKNPRLNLDDREKQFIINNIGAKLVRVKGRENKKTGKFKLEDLELNNNQVMQSYWEHLSRRTVEDGAALVDLFFREVEKERASGELLAMNMSYNETKRTLEQFGAFGIAKKIYGSSLAAADLAELNRDKLRGALSANKYYKIKVKNEEVLRRALAGAGAGTKVYDSQLASAVQALGRDRGSSDNGSDAVVVEAPAPAEPAREEVAIVEEVVEPKPVLELPVVAQEPEPTPEQALNIEPPPKPTLEPRVEPEVPSTSNPDPFAPGGFAFGGGGGATASTPDPEPEPEPAPTPDTTPPDIELNVAECADSLSPSSCLVLPGDLNISWNSTASDLDYYELAIGSATSTHSATSTSATSTLANAESVALTIWAYDTSGNRASASQVVSANAAPVLINEIAWKGTDASQADEWIELKNTTDLQISLDGWKLYSTRAGTAFATTTLSGIVEANGYYLIEHKNDTDTDEVAESPIEDVSADLWTDFGSLSDSGETLVLEMSNTNISDMVDASAGWFAGYERTGRGTMERLKDRDSSIGTSWASNKNVIKNGKDSAGNYVVGTPRQGNSVLHEIDPINNGNITEDAVLQEKYSPYISIGSLNIKNDATLTIESGVVIKFVPYSTDQLKITIQDGAKINAVGTESKPIIFTSIKDDTYEGDTNGDGVATTPSAGDWQKLHFTSTAGQSVLEHVAIRYGGDYSGTMLQEHASIYAESGTNVSVSDSTFEYIKSGALSSNGSNIVFNNSKVYGTQFGIWVYGGSLTVRNSLFEDVAQYGIRVRYLSGFTIKDSAFNGNAGYAIYVQDSWWDELAGITGSGNHFNAIVLRGDIDKSGELRMKANSLPYLLSDNLDVNVGSELTIEPGVIIKAAYKSSDFPATLLASINVYGKLKALGTLVGDIVITNILDSEVAVGVVDLLNPPTDSGRNTSHWSGINVEDDGELELSGVTVKNCGKDVYLTASSACISGTDNARINLQNVKLDSSVARIVSLFDNSLLHATSTEIMGGASTGMTLFGVSTSAYLDDVHLHDNGVDVETSSGATDAQVQCEAGNCTSAGGYAF